MRKQFDIKYRPQIESGEYKVENREGRPVRIICWDMKSEKKYGYHIVGLIEYGPQHEESTYYTIDGKGRLKDKEPDLFIVTPEPELTEFEKAIKELMRIYVKMPDEAIKETAAVLLALARKELEPEVLERLDAAYKNQDEVVYENGKRDGKAEALKDLPRWRYKENGTGPILHDCIVLNKYGCISKCPSGALLGDVWILEYDELAKLPKED